VQTLHLSCLLRHHFLIKVIENMQTESGYAPWMPTELTMNAVMAVKALQSGTATDSQQKEALDFIIMVISSTYDCSYQPGSDRDTAFAEGKRFVGNTLIKMIKMSTTNLRRGNKGDSQNIS